VEKRGKFREKIGNPVGKRCFFFWEISRGFEKPINKSKEKGKKKDEKKKIKKK
jgi:hypothetical protein